jgi:hypothetical protein
MRTQRLKSSSVRCSASVVRMIALARERLPEGFVFYDFISAWDCRWHLPLDRQAGVLTKRCHALAPGGILIFTFGGLEAPEERRSLCLWWWRGCEGEETFVVAAEGREIHAMVSCHAALPLLLVGVLLRHIAEILPPPSSHCTTTPSSAAIMKTIRRRGGHGRSGCIGCLSLLDAMKNACREWHGKPQTHFKKQHNA